MYCRVYVLHPTTANVVAYYKDIKIHTWHIDLYILRIDENPVFLKK